MGKPKTLSEKCPGCSNYYRPTDPSNRVSMRFNILGHIVKFCLDCASRKIFDLKARLAPEGKELKTLPLVHTKTKKRILVVLTDPADYEAPEATKVGEDGLLLAPTEASLAEAKKELAGPESRPSS